MTNQEIEQQAAYFAQLVNDATTTMHRYRVLRVHSVTLLRELRGTLQNIAGCDLDGLWWDYITVMEYGKLYLMTQPGVDTRYIDTVISEMSRHLTGPKKEIEITN